MQSLRQYHLDMVDEKQLIGQPDNPFLERALEDNKSVSAKILNVLDQ
ncbi:hypothetical protein L3V82_11550 [Thiotrichales bacterium 19S3-7]|nr:hypothetical protein [Thiotrichales bacterium 19S3-7]MCF6802848.1 hypothetical protein [Thiotrichales bacterium 19S3-11]